MNCFPRISVHSEIDIKPLTMIQGILRDDVIMHKELLGSKPYPKPYTHWHPVRILHSTILTADFIQRQTQTSMYCSSRIQTNVKLSKVGRDMRREYATSCAVVVHLQDTLILIERAVITTVECSATVVTSLTRPCFTSSDKFSWNDEICSLKLEAHVTNPDTSATWPCAQIRHGGLSKSWLRWASWFVLILYHVHANHVGGQPQLAC